MKPRQRQLRRWSNASTTTLRRCLMAGHVQEKPWVLPDLGILFQRHPGIRFDKSVILIPRIDSELKSGSRRTISECAFSHAPNKHVVASRRLGNELAQAPRDQPIRQRSQRR